MTVLELIAAFSASLEAAVSVFRFVNPHDLVPKLPPWGYEPAGLTIYPDAGWTPPHGIRLNHELETGYKPWVDQGVPQLAA